MADFSCSGKGVVFDENGVTKIQYECSGGHRQNEAGNPVQRWQWHSGGPRIVSKLNRYISLKIMDFTKIYLVFYGNKRGVRLNVGAGRQVNLMSATCDSSKVEVNESLRPRSVCGVFDYTDGRYTAPVANLGAIKTDCQEPRCSSASYQDPTQIVYSYGDFANEDWCQS